VDLSENQGVNTQETRAFVVGKVSRFRRNWKKWAEELAMGYGRGELHGKVSPALQSGAEGGHLTGAFNRAGARFATVREASDSPDAVLPMAEDLF
jgi:hypothetical protein